MVAECNNERSQIRWPSQIPHGGAKDRREEAGSWRPVIFQTSMSWHSPLSVRSPGSRTLQVPSLAEVLTGYKLQQKKAHSPLRTDGNRFCIPPGKRMSLLQLAVTCQRRATARNLEAHLVFQTQLRQQRKASHCELFCCTRKNTYPIPIGPCQFVKRTLLWPSCPSIELPW